MSLASTREKRSTAGNRYSKILNEAEEDEFFKTQYGGFEEEEQDNDYKEEREVSEATDSDISIDENDQVRSDLEDDEPKKKRRAAGVVTHAYKEPKPAKPAQIKDKESPKKKAPMTRRARDEKLERKSIRRSTLAKSAATRELVKTRREEERKKSKHKKPVRKERKMTQEERLEEAKITEKENLKSLEKYQKMELEKKKVRFVRKMPVGPFIRYHSVAMPLIHEVKLADGSKRKVTGKCERTFVTFEDDRSFNKAFRKTKPVVKNLYCPVYRTRAKYIDPITKLPFLNRQAFHVIRESYHHLLETKGDTTDPSVAKWLEYYQELKIDRAVAAAVDGV